MLIYGIAISPKSTVLQVLVIYDYLLQAIPSFISTVVNDHYTSTRHLSLTISMRRVAIKPDVDSSSDKQLYLQFTIKWNVHFASL